MTPQRESLAFMEHTPLGINEQKRKEKGPMETTITISTTIMKQTSVSDWSHNLNFEGEASFTRSNS